MGAWGTGLYSNDITLDIRDDYRQFLEDGNDGENLINRMKEKYSELFDTEEEYLFWIALADISFKYGRMTDEIKDKAINWIDIITETETVDEDSKRWNKTLIKLKAKLLKPEPEKKIIRQKKPLLTNPWNVGDCYAYKLHGKYAKGNGYYGKYIVFLKTGEIVTHKNN